MEHKDHITRLQIVLTELLDELGFLYSNHDLVYLMGENTASEIKYLLEEGIKK